MVALCLFLGMEETHPSPESILIQTEGGEKAEPDKLTPNTVHSLCEVRQGGNNCALWAGTACRRR